MDDLKNEFADLAWKILVSAVQRKYAKTEDLMRHNGIFVEDQIPPTLEDLVEQMKHAALQTILIEAFEEATQTTPTYIKAKGDMDSRIAKLIRKRNRALTTRVVK